ncbi:MAG: hypothetical protein ACKO3N_07205, partial [Verrucomicrobiota bacterium]
MLAVLAGSLGWSMLHAAAWQPIPQAFKQEVARHRESTNGIPGGPVQLMDVPAPGQVVAFVGGRWYAADPAGERWTVNPAWDPAAPGEFRVPPPSGRARSVAVPWAEVRKVLRGGIRAWVASADRLTEVSPDSEPRPVALPPGAGIRQVALSPAGRLWIAASSGLWEQTESGWRAEPVIDAVGRSWASTNVLCVTFDSAQRLWVGTPAGLAARGPDGKWRFFEGRDGLPWAGFTAAAAGSGDHVWWATDRGLIRWDGSDFHYRQGPRWLPSDDIRQVLADGQGRVWAATAGGLGRLEFQPMTLAAKAELYEQEIERYIQRTPFGYVAEAPLEKPAQRATANPQDSDNDGLWTAMYGAGECLAYGATRDPAALRRARRAFEALRFLQVVTQGGNPSPAKGYVARTIRPIEWPDPNVGRLESDRRGQQHDALWKAYEPRWPKSADGKWYWKGDTSSDELDGHYFFYPLYHDLCAETPAEKERVREVIRDLTDHLISHGFALVDVDGRPTRWAVYGPQDLNRSPNWWVERGLNSLSLLSYLAVAAHVTGDAKYHEVARELVEKHGYAQNLMFTKVQFGPGSGNHSDDEMAFMCFYNLLRYGKDPLVLNLARYAFFQYWALEQPELNPFFHFAFAAQALDQSVTNGWGTFAVSPWPGWLEDSRATLHGLPLDRLNWPHQNSHRLDVLRLDRIHAKDLYDPRRESRGHRAGGKVLPVENRHF